MKKIIVGLLIALVVVVALAVLAVSLFLDKAIKNGVETYGPRFTKVDIKLQSVSLSLLSGAGTIKGLVVGNPEGFKTPSAISVGEATLALKPGSLLSDKIIIKSIKLQAPEITLETDLRNNNLGKILSNVKEATASERKEPAQPQEPSQPKEARPAKKLQVDEFIITGGKVHLVVTENAVATALDGGAAVLTLPDIHLQNLGTGPEGITSAELTQLVLDAIQKSAAQASSGALADIGNGAVNIARDAANKASSNAVEKLNKGIGGFLKKK